MPDKISKEAALDKIHDLILLLQSHPTHHPLASNHNDTFSALDQLNDVFNNYSKTSQKNNPKPIKPAPILKHDHKPPRVPKAINNQALRVDMPACSPNPTPPDTPNPHNNMHNYFTHSKVTKSTVHTN